MAYVRTVVHADAGTDLKEAYDRATDIWGDVANVWAVSSLRPRTLATLIAHNHQVMGGDSGLTGAEKQMIATLVSAVNRCQY